MVKKVELKSGKLFPRVYLIKHYESFNIPQEILQYLPEETEFMKMLEMCAEDRYHIEEGISYESVRDITMILMKLVNEGETIKRSITVDDYDEFIKDVRNGVNGIGLSWSYSSGKAVEGNNEDRYHISIEAKILHPSAIDFEATYCHDQYDSYIDLNPDEEIILKKNGEIQILNINVYDRKLGKTVDYSFKDDDLIAKIKEEN
jgi:hypothetical protein